MVSDHFHLKTNEGETKCDKALALVVRSSPMHSYIALACNSIFVVKASLIAIYQYDISAANLFKLLKFKKAMQSK